MSLPKSRVRSMVLNSVLCLVAFGLLGMAVRSNWSQIQDVLSRRPNMGMYALAFGVYLIPLVLTFLRWYVLVRALDLPFRVRDALRLGFIGNVFNLVIPGAVGGDVIKGAFLCREQAKRTQAVSSMVIDRIIGLVGLFLLAGITGATVWTSADADVKRLIAVVWLAAAAGLIGLAVLFTPILYHPLVVLVRGHGKLEVFLNELITMAGSYRRRLGTVAAMLAAAVCIHALYVTSFYLVSLAIFPAAKVPSLGQHFLMVPLTLFTTAIPLPFGALGLSEQVSGHLFQMVGHPGGAVAMMAFRTIMYAGGVVSILVYLANLRQVRDLSGPDPAEPVGPILVPAES